MVPIKKLTIEKISNRHSGEYDFFVSGKSLLQELKGLGRGGMVANLGSERDLVDTQMRELLLCEVAGTTANGHIPLYVCPCRDLACGYISVKVTHSKGCFIWSNFAYHWTDFTQNEVSESVTQISELKASRFKEADYTAALGHVSH
ncbi:hypothetical protein [Roseibium sp.]|uniref:hypothetical protein n=1 Tax=Roseibium sp. TaxID=1936156 RepID=UPI003D0EA98C